jgi:hypothetical protein
MLVESVSVKEREGEARVSAGELIAHYNNSTNTLSLFKTKNNSS